MRLLSASGLLVLLTLLATLKSQISGVNGWGKVCTKYVCKGNLFPKAQCVQWSKAKDFSRESVDKPVCRGKSQRGGRGKGPNDADD
jgi:hypothetical protein